jgi:nitrous oxidase accessory protein NosD
MMFARTIAIAAAAAAIGITAAHPQAPVAGLVIERGMMLRPGIYTLASPGLDRPAVTIRASHVTIDFSGVVLRGAAASADPDTFTGLAVLVDGGEDVTIRNLSAHGYKVGLLARGTKRLHISNAHLGYNWKSRLYSGIEHESLLDWLSYHHNEHDEWLDGGAGIYLVDTDAAEVDGATIVQGQNGLMLVRSTGAKIWNSTFSYLSGIGIGLYRASRNTIMHNRVDYCVRGYSEGFYNRGQDSAGILVYEQSSRNVIAYNSVTHDGDGLFLWAGQTTMDSGEGGANDNVVSNNDFSFAPTNGIEATFSRNAFLNNRVEGNWHGVWGGYSYDTQIVGNHFAGNVEAIAIEHGQQNRIAGNTFDGDTTAIHLWQNASQDPDWGYPKHHDTRSRDYDVLDNRFIGNEVALKLGGVDRLLAESNTFDGVKAMLHDGAGNSGLAIGRGATLPGHPAAVRDRPIPPPLRGGMDAILPSAERRGRDSIIVDEWGPYDWKSAKLWPAGPSDERPLRLRVLGPAGEWRVAAVQGALASPSQGRVPGTITITPANGPVEDVDLQLEYRGAEVTSPRGIVTPAGQPYTFKYSWFAPRARWTVRYFASDPSMKFDTDPNAFAKVAAGRPVRTDTLARIDLESGGSFVAGVPADHVAVIAEADVELPAGHYEIRTISDDGLRVSVDDERVIDDWTPHESKIDRAPLDGGRHHLRIEYYEVTGFAELRFDILRR